MPTLVDWCASAEARLPKERIDPDFVRHLEQLFNAHHASVAALVGGNLEQLIQAESSTIHQLSDGLLETVREYLRGHPSRAYTTFAAAVSPVAGYLRALRAAPGTTRIPPAYRMRVSAVPQRFEPIDNFHIPFQLRGIVSSQRYSIPGLPCLYLGASAYVCWEEMGRPAFSSIYVMQLRFRDPTTLRLLDIAYIPQFLPDLIQIWNAAGPSRAAIESIIVALAVCWPLVAACSTRARDPGAMFKPEYVIPQLLLQWVTQETDWHGIRYFSTKVGNPRGVWLGTNFVFPVRSLQASGHCPALSGLFEATSVWNWEVALATNQSMRSSGVQGEIETAPGSYVDYMQTDFWKIESMLNERPSRPL